MEVGHVNGRIQNLGEKVLLPFARLKHRAEKAKPPSEVGFQPEGLCSLSATASASRSKQLKPVSPPTNRCAR